MFSLALVGRANVGKTSLFNFLTSTNYALVSNELNSTVDFNYGLLSFNDGFVICIDTCSFLNLCFLKYLNKNINDYNTVLNNIQKKYIFLLNRVDLICLLVDASVGVLFDDMFLSNSFLKLAKNNLVVIVNKIDKKNYINNFFYNFYSLGIKDLYYISVSQNIGIKDFVSSIFLSKKYNVIINNNNVFLYIDMLNLCVNLNRYYYFILKLFGLDKNIFINKNSFCVNLRNIFKIVIVGKPNVGKSTFFNSVSKYNISIVSNISGTTKDFIFSNFFYKDNNYILVDTPGLYKNLYSKGNFLSKEFFRKILLFKIILFVVDINEGLSKYDLYLLNLFLNKGKLLILIFNKCDKIKLLNIKIYKEKLFIKYNFIKNIYIYFISAIKLNEKFINGLFYFINKMYKNVFFNKISSSKLTKILIKATNFYNYKNLSNLVKLKYAHIGGYYPFTIIIHGNKINLINNSYKQYLVNFYMKYLNLLGLKINLKFKEIFNPFKKLIK